MFTKNVLIDGLTQEHNEKLSKKRVLVIGDNDLAKSVVLNLGVANFGRIGVWGADKVEVFKKFCTKNIKGFEVDIFGKDECLEKIIDGFDIVVGCLVDFEQKFFLNDLAIKYKKPLVYSFLRGEHAQLALILPCETACLKCMYPEKVDLELDSTYQDFLSSAISAILVDVVICWALQLDDEICQYLLTYNAIDMEFNKIKLTRNSSCLVCSK